MITGRRRGALELANLAYSEELSSFANVEFFGHCFCLSMPTIINIEPNDESVHESRRSSGGSGTHRRRIDTDRGSISVAATRIRYFDARDHSAEDRSGGSGSRPAPT